MSSPARPIEVLGSLELTAPGGEVVTLEGLGSSLRIDVPKLGLVRSLRRTGQLIPAAVAAAVVPGTVAVEVLLGRWWIARWSPGVRPGLLARVLGWAPFQLSFSPLSRPRGRAVGRFS